MSTIKSSTTLTTAYSVEADTTGTLVIQTGATPTTAVTVSSAQVVTLANALPVASGGTGATTNAGAAFALKGANSDITSLSGLTTALSVAQGGTGVTTSTGSGSVVLGTSPSISGAVLSSMASSVISSGTAVAVSGTSVQFTGVPSWVKRITMLFYNGVSSNGTSMFQIQIGSGSFTTSGYTAAQGLFVNASGSSWTTLASGFPVFNNNPPDTINGSMVLSLATGNTWVISGITIATNRGIMNNTTGFIALGGTLDRIRLTTVNGTDTFDAGSINILYE